MLAVAAVLSLILLAGAFFAARPAPHPVRWPTFIAFATGTVVVASCGVFSPVVVGLAVALTVSLALWPWVRRRIRSFIPLACGSTILAYGIAFWAAFQRTAEYDRLREEYRYESMEDRVPAPIGSSVRNGPAEGDGWRVGLEAELEGQTGGARVFMLRQLHEHRVREFANSPGFGVMRMVQPSESWLRPRPRGETPAQPPGSPVTPDGHLSATDEPDLMSLHGQGLLDFVNPGGFGYVKDRRHVAGFLPHAFSEVPGPATRWKVDRLDLIGLLLHPEPVAYVSDRLPAMQELRAAPTRKLDGFEAAGLEVIRSGQLLYIGSHDGRARMIGAIRSAKQCVGCHGGERGDLLGAFSYTLAPVTDSR